jgi:hypothetical protein
MAWSGWSRTNVGPLTTVFTPPTACFTPAIESDADPSVFQAYYGNTCIATGTGSTLVLAPSCYPPGTGIVFASYSTMPFYSPGLSCPAGFTSACAVTRVEGETLPQSTRSTDPNIWSMLEPGETAIACCPT